MKLTTLAALIEKLQAATEPSRELDKSIAWYCQYEGYAKNWQSFREHMHKHDFQTAFIAHGQWLLEYTPAFTKSLDAAMELIPGELSYIMIGDSPQAVFQHGEQMRNTVSLTGPGCKHLNQGAVKGLSASHPSPVIAMCLAVLEYVALNNPTL